VNTVSYLLAKFVNVNFWHAQKNATMQFAIEAQPIEKLVS